MAATQVGTFPQQTANSGGAHTTLVYTPQNVGDLVVLDVVTNSPTTACTGITAGSGGCASWTQVGTTLTSNVAGGYIVSTTRWMGVISAAVWTSGSVTATALHPSTPAESKITGSMFTDSALRPNVTWTVDVNSELVVPAASGNTTMAGVAVTSGTTNGVAYTAWVPESTGSSTASSPWAFAVDTWWTNVIGWRTVTATGTLAAVAAAQTSGGGYSRRLTIFKAAVAGTNVTAGRATGTGTANTPAVAVAVPAGLAAGTGTAHTAGATDAESKSVTAGRATGTGTAGAPGIAGISNAAAGRAAGTGQAYLADTSDIDPIGAPFLLEQVADAFVAVEAAWGADLHGDPDAWVWADLTQDVQVADGKKIEISGVGRTDEAGTTSSAQLKVQLDNRAGLYSLGPQSANYPYIRRGTPIRVRVDPGTGVYNTRFLGFADGWEPRWDITGRNASVTLSASGTLRRLGQNQAPVSSAMRRATVDRSDVVAYWPCEDGKDAKTIASGLPGGAAMQLSGAAEQPYPKFASSDTFICSSELPEVQLTTWHGVVPEYTGTGAGMVRFLLGAPAVLAGVSAVLVRIYATGSVARWDLEYGATEGGVLNLRAYGADGVEIDKGVGTIAFNVDDTARQYSVIFVQDGTDLTWGIETLAQNYRDGGFFYGTLTGEQLGIITSVVVAPDANVDDTVIGHVAVHSQYASIYSQRDPLNGNADEYPDVRLERLAAENGTNITIVGGLPLQRMGPQQVDDLVSLLRECELVDQGLLYDGTHAGLTYITGAARVNRPADLVLDVAAGHLADELAPTEDDQRTVNKVKATRSAGADAIYEDVTGPLGTTAIGIYDDSIEVNIRRDRDVVDYAGWGVHLGTVEGYRWPELHLNFAHDPDLIPSWLDTTLSSRIDVRNVNTVRQLPESTLSLLLEGYTEEIDRFEWTVSLNCSPYEPWRVGLIAADTGDVRENVMRLDTDGSTLAAGAAAGATSLSVASTAGPLWTTTADDLPLVVEIAGTPVTVTAISGTSSPQTFTVTGVVRALPAGSTVQLWHPPVLGM